MSNITASIVIYNTNSDILNRLINCLNSDGSINKLFIIDNSPLINKLDISTLFDVELIYPECNVGYGRGHNLAISKILETSEYHFVINPDIYFNDFAIRDIIKRFEKDKNIGQIMPKVMNPDGSIQYLCKLLPSPIDLIGRRFLRNIFKSYFNHRNDIYELRFTNYDKELNVPYLSGCFMALRVSALKSVGIFDDRYFMYPEDIDLTRRIHAKYITLFYPFVKIYHEHSKASYKNFRMLVVHIINIIKYFNKWGWFFDSDRKKINNKVLSTFDNKFDNK